MARGSRSEGPKFGEQEGMKGRQGTKLPFSRGTVVWRGSEWGSTGVRSTGTGLMVALGE